METMYDVIERDARGDRDYFASEVAPRDEYVWSPEDERDTLAPWEREGITFEAWCEARGYDPEPPF